jgi:hypothetical protein
MGRRCVLVPLIVLLAAPGCTCQRRGEPGGVSPVPSGAAPGAPAQVDATGPAAPVTPRAAPAGSSPGTVVTPTPLTACKADADCVAMAGDCCGCNAGGSQAVVTRAKLDEFEAARSSRCREAVCVALMSSHPSCRQEARCVEGSCRLVDPPRADGGAPPAATLEAPQ